MGCLYAEHLMVIECDYPECGNTTISEDIAPGNWWPDERVLNAKGWTFITFHKTWLAFCPKCRDKKLPTDQERKFHNCVYETFTKKGKPSDHGSIRRCYICDGLDREAT